MEKESRKKTRQHISLSDSHVSEETKRTTETNSKEKVITKQRSHVPFSGTADSGNRQRAK